MQSEKADAENIGSKLTLQTKKLWKIYHKQITTARF